MPRTFWIGATGALALLAVSNACSSDGGSSSGAVLSDAGADTGAETAPPDGTSDASLDAPPDGGTGETCIGFAKGEPCGAGGLPDYGYICVGGSPPGIAGCVLARASSLGDTYCCAANACVAQPDQDKECKSASTPHRYQCPPEGDAGNVTPPAGCVASGTSGSALEKFYCCP